jgi:thiopeptide-type bacteriocin biosynthesis protein
MTATTSRYDGLRTPLVAARTPLMPIETILNLFAADDVSAALREFLASSSLARQAIRISSEALADAVDDWCVNGIPPNAVVPLRALAYVARMSARCTPFGICAGIGVVDIGEQTTLSIDLHGRRALARPDMQIVAELRKAVSEGVNRERIRFVTNEGAFKKGGRLYVANVLLANRSHRRTEQRPVSLKETDAVRFVRDIAITPISYKEMSDRLSVQFNVPPTESEKLLDALIEAGIIISELNASPIGDPVSYLFDKFADLDVLLAPNLKQVLTDTGRLGTQAILSGPLDLYEETLRSCEALIKGPPKPAIQVDMHVPFRGDLGCNVLSDVALLGEYFMRMGVERTLKKFKDRFVARYEAGGRLVPLLELVDSNIGLGNPEDPEFLDEPNPAREALLTRIACDSMRHASMEIELNSDDIDVIAPPLNSRANLQSLELGFHIMATSREAIDRDEYCVVSAGFLGSMGAARSLGRFMHFLGDDAYERAKLLRCAEAQSAISAELVYAPVNARTYNVFVRPRLIDTEIQVGVVDTSAPDRIDLNDLWVGLDGSHLFLWSNSRQSRVEPTETHVFNTSGLAPNLCRLLSFIGSDGKRMIRGFPWGSLATLTALPRIRVGRLVLSPRQWRFAASEFEKSATSATQMLQRYREQWSMPRFVVLCEGDNRLPLDLDSQISGALLNDRLSRNARYVSIEEMLPAPSETWLTGDAEGRYVAEFIASLVPNAVEGRTADEPQSPTILPSRPAYGPGSAWLYMKVYLASQAVEDFLLRRVAPAIAALRDSDAIDRWFFVRYADPDSHLRIRVRSLSGRERALREHFLDLAESALSGGDIVRYALETYEPEYERYGGVDAMGIVERFFTTDSDACVDNLRRSDHSIDARVALAAESFFPWLAGSAALQVLALDAFEESAKGKLDKVDREALKRLLSLDIEPRRESILADALEGADPKYRVKSIFHMHCNRLGVLPFSESRAAKLLRAMILARRARS